MIKTKITDSEKLNEIKKISDRLDADEEVFQAIKQTKNPLKILIYEVLSVLEDITYRSK